MRRRPGRSRRRWRTPATQRAGPGGVELPPLAPGEDARLGLPAFVPGLPFGSYRLRYAAEVPGGRFAGSLPLDNAVTVALTAAPGTVGDGQTLAAGVEVANTGDFAVTGTLTLEAVGLLPEAAGTLDLLPGAVVRRDFTAVVSEATPLGGHVVTAGFRAAGAVPASARVVVPPARLDYLAPPAEAAAGGPLTITAVNTRQPS